MKTMLKTGMLMGAVLFVITLLIWQRQQITQLRTEAATLREQAGQADSLREQNLHFAEQLKAAADSLQADRNDLMRLRAQAARLRQVEQENAQLKIERQNLANRAIQAQLAVPPSEPPTTVPASEPAVGAAPTKLTDLGVIELSDRAPKQLDLGAGQNCVITPTVLADGSIQMDIAVEGKTADGNAEQSTLSRLTVLPGATCAISVGDRMIALTPKLKAQ